MRLLLPCALIALLVALPTVGGWSVARLQAQRLSVYQPVPAVIVKSQAVAQGLDSYSLKVEYTYERAGQPHTATRLGPLDLRGNEAWATDLARRYPAQLTTTAYVNPADSKDAFLVRETIFTPYTFALIGPVIVMFFMVKMLRGGAFRAPPQARLCAPSDWFVVQPGQTRLAVALWATAATLAWYGYGALTAGHYFTFANSATHNQAWGVLGIYALLGLIPVRAMIQRWRLARRYGDMPLEATLPRFHLKKPIIVRISPHFKRPTEVREIRLALTCRRVTGFSAKRVFVMSGVLERDQMYPAGAAAALEHTYEATRQDLPVSRPFDRLYVPRIDWEFELLIIPRRGPALHVTYPVQLVKDAPNI